MRIINSRGRVLLEVTKAHSSGLGPGGLQDLTYSYSGPGIGGHVTTDGLQRQFDTIKADCPSAKIIGVLPEPCCSGLCPICGENIYLTGKLTDNNRLIGSCGDAFTWAQWESD